MGDLLTYLAPALAKDRRAPTWPPDLFGLTASLLLQSGAYLQVVSKWPPTGTKADGCLKVPAHEWGSKLRDIGSRWRDGWPDVPHEVMRWWRLVCANYDLPLRAISTKRALCNTLLQLTAAADEACVEVGYPFGSDEDLFNFVAEAQLIPSETGSTLCQRIHPSRLRVLPKCHTPQAGITLDSLSHHLALWPAGDVQPRWFSGSLARRWFGVESNVNLLLLPWPLAVLPPQFRPIDPCCGDLANMPPSHGFFTFEPRSDPRQLLERLEQVYGRALEVAGRIHMAVLPELALDRAGYEAMRNWCVEKELPLLCGVGERSAGVTPGKNYVALDVPISDEHVVHLRQEKHHRWRLDKAQIVQYGLGGQLDPDRQWWEHTSADARIVNFVVLSPWLSFCFMVCEDLARQEPVARLVHAVGPNLVIALLMDGPQLSSRWPARYATVLADDPGSSVLTLTSAGMAQLSRPPGRDPSRVVALWKDAKSGAAREIDLPAGKEGVVLNLARHSSEEWSADGRSDEGIAGYPILAGVHPI